MVLTVPFRCGAQYQTVKVEAGAVEGFASKAEWRRGYEEINEFEQMMVADGIGRRCVLCGSSRLNSRVS
jgi:polyphosphate kinase 2 (PPK2 family)